MPDLDQTAPIFAKHADLAYASTLAGALIGILAMVVFGDRLDQGASRLVQHIGIPRLLIVTVLVNVLAVYGGIALKFRNWTATWIIAVLCVALFGFLLFAPALATGSDMKGLIYVITLCLSLCLIIFCVLVFTRVKLKLSR